jgi:hypothetical protein
MTDQSTIVINSADQLFIEKTLYSLQKAGFKVTEDYTNCGVRIIVFTK